MPADFAAEAVLVTGSPTGSNWATRQKLIASGVKVVLADVDRLLIEHGLTSARYRD